MYGFDEIPVKEIEANTEHVRLDLKDSDAAKNAQVFWNKVFEKEEAEEEITTDVLICEIYGRSEEEFEFDYDVNEKIRNIQESFEPNEWDLLSDVEKKEVLQSYADAIAESLGIEDKPAVIYYDGDWGSYGAFSQYSNTVEINEKYLNDPKVLRDTIPHEVRHAYQHCRAEKFETTQDLLYKVNFEQYISPYQLLNGKYMFFTDYQDQLVEAEARAFAKLFQ